MSKAKIYFSSSWEFSQWIYYTLKSHKKYSSKTSTCFDNFTFKCSFLFVSDFFTSVTSSHHGVQFYLRTKHSAQFLKPTLPLTPSITVFVFKTSTPALLEGNYDPIQVMGRQPPRIALKERIYQEAKLRTGCSRMPISYLNRLDPTLPTYSNKWV